jgi:hypothetical protein
MFPDEVNATLWINGKPVTGVRIHQVTFHSERKFDGIGQEHTVVEKVELDMSASADQQVALEKFLRSMMELTLDTEAALARARGQRYNGRTP